MSDEAHPGKMHIYNLRGYCWCGAHRDDWFRDENNIELIAKALRRMNEEAAEQAGPEVGE